MFTSAFSLSKGKLGSGDFLMITLCCVKGEGLWQACMCVHTSPKSSLFSVTPNLLPFCYKLFDLGETVTSPLGSLP